MERYERYDFTRTYRIRPMSSKPLIWSRVRRRARQMYSWMKDDGFARAELPVGFLAIARLKARLKYSRDRTKRKIQE